MFEPPVHDTETNFSSLRASDRGVDDWNIGSNSMLFKAVRVCACLRVTVV